MEANLHCVLATPDQFELHRQQIVSPDGATCMDIWLDSSATLCYRLQFGGEEIISKSQLGIVSSDYRFDRGLTPASIGVPRCWSDRFNLPHGKQRTAQITATESVWELVGADPVKLVVSFRVFDRGVGFRYQMISLDPSVEIQRIEAECSTFNLNKIVAGWLQSTPSQPGHHSPAYEDFYQTLNRVDLEESEGCWNLPALFQTASGWLLISESDLDRQYCGVHLQVDREQNHLSDSKSFSLRFPYPYEGEGLGDTNPTVTLPATLPWRVICLGSNPGEIANSNLVNHLSRPSIQTDWSWVKPGRATWSWWSDPNSPQNIGVLSEYVQFAVEQRWEYVLIDANWDALNPVELRRLIRSANELEVGVWLWYNSGGPHNRVTESPRDRMHLPKARREELAKISELGIVGIKVDFFHRDKQSGMELFEQILEDAHRFKLMVNFHGCSIPRGWTRRWPHLLTVESVLGAEQYAFMSEFPTAAPGHHTVLPFTRNAIGPMDYTPVTFSAHNFPHLTTSAHELALSVVFESGIAHWADSIRSYRSQPKAVLEWLATVPVVWDELKILSVNLGEHVLLARRNEEVWYIAAINGQEHPMELLLELGELNPTEAKSVRSYSILFFADELARTGSGFHIEEETVGPESKINIELAGYGGWLSRITPNY